MALVLSNIYDLLVNDKPVPIRSDGFVDVTELCKLAGKEFKKWKRLAGTDDLIRRFQKKSNDRDVTGKAILELHTTGSKHCWASPELAVHIAGWCDPEIQFDVAQYYVRIKQGDPTLHAELDKNREEWIGLQTRLEEAEKRAERAKEELKIHTDLLNTFRAHHGSYEEMREWLGKGVSERDVIEFSLMQNGWTENHADSFEEYMSLEAILNENWVDLFKVEEDAELVDVKALTEHLTSVYEKAVWRRVCLRNWDGSVEFRYMSSPALLEEINNFLLGSVPKKSVALSAKKARMQGVVCEDKESDVVTRTLRNYIRSRCPKQCASV